MSTIACEEDYAEAVAWLLGRIDYERMLSVPYRAREYRLDRMRELLARLGNPQRRLSIVHVAGTKGKGSTAAMIAGVLSAAGMRTGLFTSPHLDGVEERLAIDGRPCTPARLATLVAELRRVVDMMDVEAARTGGDPGPTYFELTTALALMHFVSAEVDAAVLEVGMGGRLDSTNICQPLCSVITSISFDHTEQLGNTLALIAREKAGIIKPGVPVVSGVVADEPRQVIAEVARERGAALVELSTDFDFEYRPAQRIDLAAGAGSIDFWHRPPPAQISDFRFQISNLKSQISNRTSHIGPARLDHLALGMPGRHQGANAAVAVATIEQLRGQGWRISDEAVRRGIGQTRCRARVELVSREPAVVIDAAHNGASVAALLEVIAESFAAGRRRLIFATSRDKDARGMMALLLPAFDEVILTRYQKNPRGMPPEQLSEIAGELGFAARCSVEPDSAAAFQAACRGVQPGQLIVVTGSFFIAAEIRRMVVAEAATPPA